MTIFLLACLLISLNIFEAIIDKAKEVLGDIACVTMLCEENVAIYKESQWVSEELEQVKRELAKAKEDFPSLADKNAKTVQDLNGQLSRRQDESTAVDDKQLRKLFQTCMPYHEFFRFLSRKCLFLTLYFIRRSHRLWRGSG